MFTAEFVLRNLNRNLELMMMHIGTMTHEQSLVAPHPRGNCAYWILGHLNVYRTYMLRDLGSHPHLSDATAARFVAGSAPVRGHEPGLPRFEALRSALLNTQKPIETLLLAASPDILGAVHTQGTFSLTAAEWLLFRLRHEAFHVGQFELLGEIARG